MIITTVLIDGSGAVWVTIEVYPLDTLDFFSLWPKVPRICNKIWEET